MGQNLDRKLIFTLLFITTTILTSQAYAYNDVSPSSLTIKVYPDGSSRVSYMVEPDTTKARVNITLFGENYNDLLVTDQNDLILDWRQVPGGVQVDSLGSTRLTLSYITTSLTNKTGNQWSVSVNSPIKVIYILPENSVLVKLSPTPLSISMVENQATITMSNSTSIVGYIIGVTGTKEQALVKLNQAEDIVSTIKAQGIIVDDAESLIDQARTAFNQGGYSQSEQLSTHATELARETEQLANQAQARIQEAEQLIQEKTGQVEPAPLAEAEAQRDSAIEAYNQGEYAEAYASADQAYKTAAEAPEPRSGNTMLIAAGVVIVAAAGALIYLRSRAPLRKEPEQPRNMVDVDLGAVFRERPSLRTDDKAVLRYVHESGGAFITEVRDRFDIPKSSAWRMMNRLEGEGLIETSKVGRETYIQIKEQ